MAFQARLYHHPILVSTMDEARALATTQNVPEGVVVQADQQTSGRGRFGNTWTSPLGNLYMTLVLRPRVATTLCAQLSFVVAVALADTLKALGVPAASTKLKWPNDVLIDGRKIAGILLEMQSGQKDMPDFLLAGIGVNVVVPPEAGIGIASFAPHVDVTQVRTQLVADIARWYDIWQEQGFAHVRTRWLENAYGVGQPVTARMADKSAQGVFEGIDVDGNLIMREANGQARIINSAAVHFAPAPS